MLVKRGSRDDREVVVRYNKRGRELARKSIRYIELACLPPGYVLDDERIHKNRAGNAGNRLDVTVVLYHQNTKEPQMSTLEWLERLEHVEDLDAMELHEL